MGSQSARSHSAGRVLKRERQLLRGLADMGHLPLRIMVDVTGNDVHLRVLSNEALDLSALLRVRQHVEQAGGSAS